MKTLYAEGKVRMNWKKKYKKVHVTLIVDYAIAMDFENILNTFKNNILKNHTRSSQNGRQNSLLTISTLWSTYPKS